MSKQGTIKRYLNNHEIDFNIIPLTFKSRDVSSVFYNKNNKTLGQTFEHPKYYRLNSIFSDKYKVYKDMPLGVFLKTLKESNDNNYLYFLNKYGDSKFCEFKIETNLNDKGIYCFIENNKIKYVGRCTDNFKKRINQGYGKIHPKNCFIDGQATNCHLNSLINSSDSDNVKFGIYVMSDKTTDEIKELEKLILNYNKFDWNIQTS